MFARHRGVGCVSSIAALGFAILCAGPQPSRADLIAIQIFEGSIAPYIITRTSTAGINSLILNTADPALAAAAPDFTFSGFSATSDMGPTGDPGGIGGITSNSTAPAGPP